MQLKIIIAPIVDDINRIIDNVQMELDVCDSSSSAVGFVRIVKGITQMEMFGEDE